MTTKNPRLNITLDKDELGLLATLAKKDKKSLSATAKNLIIQALELQEDLYLSRLAEKRDNESARWISHEKAWK